MSLAWFALLIILHASTTAAAGIILRCEYTDPVVRGWGHFYIVRVDATIVSVTSYNQSGSWTRIFRVVEQTEDMILARRTYTNGARAELVLDRVTGRLTEGSEVLGDRSQIWNYEKQQFGGFDPDKELWTGAVLDCAPNERAF